MKPALFTALLLAPLAALPAADTKPTKPNIVVILTDDLGFSDVGCYGSEIETPNLDRLAANGLRFTQFYNGAKCHVSRVSLMSGRWDRQAGSTSLSRAVTIPEMLGSAGYFSAMTGKWNLQKSPVDFGFQRALNHDNACNYFLGDRTFRLNGKPWAVPQQGFYTTVANVDFGLRFIAEARAANKPWFLYLAFNAPHEPLQPMEADYKKYLGKYDAGWDVMRAARVAKQKQLGLFGRDVEASPRPDHVPAWASLTPGTRAWEARRMAAYAGLIDRVDQELGRLIADLKRAGEFDNTLIFFLSDNGACPYDRRSKGRDLEPYNPQSSWKDSTGWAWARNSPFRYYKQNQFEGGIATPAIVHWPAGLKTKPGSLVHTPAHLVDVLPTLAEICGASIPTNWPGRDLSPLAGVSLAPIFSGQEIKSRPPIHLLFAGDRGFRDGDWKLVSFQSQPWELYNLAQDRAEIHNVAAQHPDIVARMTKQWTDMAKDVLQAPPRERKPVAATAEAPQLHKEWTDYAAPTRELAKGKKRRGQAAPPASAENTQPQATGGGPAQPNIVVIVSDDQGYQDLGCYGGPVQTPVLDRLATQGVRCTSFYAHPVCSPTRAALFTGRHPLRTGMNNVIRVQDNDTAQLAAGEVLLPAFLKRGGYTTGLFGKWHLGFGVGARPTERGFDEFFGHAAGMTDYWKHVDNNQKPDFWLGTNAVPREGYSTDLFADAARDFIRRRKDRPFFLCLAFNAPHSGVNAKGEIPSPEEFIKRYPDEPDRLRKTYKAAVTAMDAAIGRVLDELEKQNLADNTLVVFFSDNGGLNRSGGRNAPLRGEKSQAWEGGVRVPTIVRWPGKLPAGKTCDEMLTVMDIFPLCLNAAGVALPAPSERILDGREPLPALAGKAPSPHDTIGFDVGARQNRQWAIRDRAGYKLIAGNKGGEPGDLALYDLSKDISEQNNLAATQPERVSAMRQAFDRWRETVKRFNIPTGQSK